MLRGEGNLVRKQGVSAVVGDGARRCYVTLSASGGQKGLSCGAGRPIFFRPGAPGCVGVFMKS